MNDLFAGMARERPPVAVSTVPLDESCSRVLWHQASALPEDAVALLARQASPPGTMGARRAGGEWILTFRPRWGGRADPLMGWWGEGDPLSCVTLRFPTREAAEAYARRVGVALEICEPPQARGGRPWHGADALCPAGAPPADPALCWVWDGRSLEREVAGAAAPPDGEGRPSQAEPDAQGPPRQARPGSAESRPPPASRPLAALPCPPSRRTPARRLAA